MTTTYLSKALLVKLNDTCIVPTSNLGTVTFTTSNVPAGATVDFEATSDNVTWYAATAYQKAAKAAGVTSTSTNGSYSVATAGAQFVRARLSAVLSGTVTVTANGTSATSHMQVKNSVAADLKAEVTQGNLVPKGFQQLPVLTNALKLMVPAGARFAKIQALDQAVNWRDDGVAPTAGLGMQIAAGTTLDYHGSLAALQLIQVAPGAIANISYYG
jgi:hypothetical protein